jgi:hypothetical protein
VAGGNIQIILNQIKSISVCTIIIIIIREGGVFRSTKKKNQDCQITFNIKIIFLKKESFLFCSGVEIIFLQNQNFGFINNILT